MRPIALIGASLVLAAGVVNAAQAQGVGYPPGVNPSNPQDLTYRSNPQDLLVPGGNNPQDLVRRPPGRSVIPELGRGDVTSIAPPASLSPGLRYTVKSEPKPKPRHKPRHHKTAAQR